jgi:hypothetical protein
MDLNGLRSQDTVEKLLSMVRNTWGVKVYLKNSSIEMEV